MSLPVSNAISLLKDYSRNQNLTDARSLRALTTAIQFLSIDVGLPGHEKEYTFNFFQDDVTFGVPTDFAEPISLRFQEDRLNRNQRFTFKPGELLFQRVDAVTGTTRLWGTYMAGSPEVIYVLAKNSTADFTVDNFDLADGTNWTASNDATNITTDTVTFKEGVASLSFDINVALSVNNRATLTRTFSQTSDLSTFTNRGYFKAWVYLQDVTNFTSVSLTWGNDASNYWKVTATTQNDGSALAVGWNKIAWQWNGATTVGSPDATAVDYYVIDFDYGAGYTSQTSMRVDFLRVENPDVAIMSYYVNSVGTDSSGSPITVFSSTTDLFLFGTRDPGLMQLVALEAAIILNPQLLVDDVAVRRSYNMFRNLYAKRWPKKRVNNLLAEPLTPTTSRQSP